MGRLLTRPLSSKSDTAREFGGDGEAVLLLHRVGHRYVAGIRLVTLIPTVGIAVLVAGESRSEPAALAALGVLVGWSVLYSWLLIRRPDSWLTLVDAAVLVGLAVSSSWVVSVGWLASGKSWLLPFLAFSCVAYQYYAGVLLGSVAATAVLTAMIVGTSAAVPTDGSFDSVHTAIWSVVLVALGRVFWILVHRGGRRADAALAIAAAARRDQLLAQEIRADELEHNRRLHDTAATTLLMVGLGQAKRSAAILTAQARRDVEALSGHRETMPARTDLVGAIATVIDLTPLAVEYHHPVEVFLPSAVVHAISGACQEALGNILRHTDETACLISVVGEGDRVCVDIVDGGCGFNIQERSPTRRGLSDSISGRLTSVGGLATVTTRPGVGTSVHLAWPDDRR